MEGGIEGGGKREGCHWGQSSSEGCLQKQAVSCVYLQTTVIAQSVLLVVFLLAYQCNLWMLKMRFSIYCRIFEERELVPVLKCLQCNREVIHVVLIYRHHYNISGSPGENLLAMRFIFHKSGWKMNLSDVFKTCVFLKDETCLILLYCRLGFLFKSFKTLKTHCWETNEISMQKH